MNTTTKMVLAVLISIVLAVLWFKAVEAQPAPQSRVVGEVYLKPANATVSPEFPKELRNLIGDLILGAVETVDIKAQSLKEAGDTIKTFVETRLSASSVDAEYLVGVRKWEGHDLMLIDIAIAIKDESVHGGKHVGLWSLATNKEVK